MLGHVSFHQHIRLGSHGHVGLLGGHGDDNLRLDAVYQCLHLIETAGCVVVLVRWRH